MGYCKKHNQKGFTIFELIVVLAIIGILAGVLYPKLQNRETAAKIQACETDMFNIYKACEAWKEIQGQPNFEGLTYAALGTAGLWDTSKLSPWGDAYYMLVSSTGGTNGHCNIVFVFSGVIPDRQAQIALCQRFLNKGYYAKADVYGAHDKKVYFRAPY